MAVRIQFRRGTAAEWTSANPVLAAGELGYETDTTQMKIGNGSTTWENLTYSSVSASYVDNAIANVIDLAPGTLDTLNELAQAINDDNNFFGSVTNSITTAVSDHSNVTTNVHGISNTANLVYSSTLLLYAPTNNPTFTGSVSGITAEMVGLANVNNTSDAAKPISNATQNALDLKLNLSGGTMTGAITLSGDPSSNLHAATKQYVDNTIANVIDFAPSALDTLNELAAAINDDNNFYNTIVGYIDNTVDSVVGDHATDTANIHGISNTFNLVYSADMASYVGNAVADILDNSSFTGTISLPSTTSIGDISATEIGYLDNVSSNIQTQLDAKAPTSSPTFTGTVGLPSTTSIGDVSGTEIGYLNNVTSNIQTQLDAKAPADNAVFTGSITLPSNTSIGNVTATEIGYLDNVSSNVQSQLDAKLATSSAASIYAPITDPVFINSVSLPANTIIGDVSSTEIGYLNNVSSAIQTQLDAKAPTANPTFTGTVSGITASMVGLGSVNNTSDLDKPISNATQSALDAKAPLANATFSGTISLPSTTSIGDISATEIGYLDNVSSNIQTQLNAKLSLSGGTMTGAITLSGDPTQALHAVTKQYVDNISAGLHVHEAVHVATNNTLANLCGSTVTYDNGTDGVGATLTLGASLSTIDGHSLTNGDRILVKNEATASRNGIYVRTSATVLTRATDFDSSAEIAGGDFVFVENGTLYNSTGWVVENEVNTVGTDNVLWTQFSGAGTVTAGNNISVSGLQVSVADSPSFTGTVTLPATTSIGPVSGTEIGYLDNVTSNIQTQINAKANTASPTFTGLVTVAANGIAFTDGTQTKEGVPSITAISQKTDSYTLAALTERDTIIEISNASAKTLTVPADSTLNFPVGTTLDVIQTGAGQVTIAAAGGVTINATPGLKLRTQWSSATLLKRAANTWLAFGDLSA